MAVNLKEFEKKLDFFVQHLSTEFQSIRGNRPSPRMVEDISVEAYDQRMSVKALGSISVVPPREIQISLWDQSVVNAVVKAIENSSLNVVANVDGNLIRINLPQLTEERKKEMEKIIRKITEEARIKVRSSRDEINKEIKKQEEAGELSEDAAYKEKEKVQDIVNGINKKIEELLDNKVKEIFE